MKRRLVRGQALPRWLTLAATLVAVVWLAAGARAAAPATDWAQAQAQEARALRAELAALEKSLAETRASTKAAKSSLTGEIESLSAQLTRARAQNDALQADLPARERQRSDASHAAALDDVLLRLRALLQDEGVAVEEQTSIETLPALVEKIFERIRRESALHVDPQGEYFDTDGKQRAAPILHVGRVAAMVWDHSNTPLVSTPQGLRAVQGVQARRAPLAAGASAATVVLHDPRDPPAPSAYVDGGWRAKMDTGGPIMWVLLVIGVIALLIIAERAIGLTWARQRWRREQRRFEHAVRQRRTSKLLDVKGWIAKPLIIAASARCPSCSTAVDTDVEERATQALMVMRERLLRRLSLVNVAAGVAPLLGLLGTVTGMIHTFSVVTDTGTSEPQQLAAGISQALLTTQFGLAIAIPAFLAHALLSRGARRILASAEQTVLWYLHGADPLVEVVAEDGDGDADRDAGEGDSDAA